MGVCVFVSLSVCVHLHCLLHLQGLDGAKGDKVSLPFCLVEEIRRGFGYKGGGTDGNRKRLF